MFKKTSFTLGLMLGLSFAVPLFFGRYIGDEYQLLTLPIVFAVLFGGTVLYGDAQNAAGAQKAFAKFKEKVLNVPSGVIGITGSNFDLFKDAVYNSYLMGMGKFDECVGFFEWVCENPSDKLAFLASHYRLGEVYRALGSSDEAEREYRTVAESDKDIYAVRMAKQRLAELAAK